MKTLKCNDLTYLEDLPLFKDKVKFKLNQDEYTVKESYMEYKKGKTIDIKDSRCYQDNITDYEISLVTNNVIDSYKCEGPAIFSYRKPMTQSTRFIINREGKSIGYKISTGDIMNCTKTMDHIIFSTKTENLLRVTKEFYKGKEADKENPKLNMLVDINLVDVDGLFLTGEETRTSFDADGNIEDLVIGNGVYAYTSTGEFICVDMKYTYMSSEDDKRNVIPKLVSSSDEKYFYVHFYQKEKPNEILATEYFEADHENEVLCLREVTVGNKTISFGNVTSNGIEYKAVTKAKDKKYIVQGVTNYPLSSDYFVFDEYKGIVSLSVISYFNNIYESEYMGEGYLTDSHLTYISVEEDDKPDFILNYYWDKYYKSQKYSVKHGKEIDEEKCKINLSLLPNGNKVVESLILADPLNVKSIFYEAIELDKDDNKVSSYKALAVKHIDR